MEAPKPDVLLWNRAEVRRQLGGVSDAFLDALTAKGYLAPLFRGRYLPEEVAGCIVKLRKDRDEKPRKKSDGDGEEKGREVSGVGEGGTGTEGTEGVLRPEPEGGGREGAGAGGRGARAGYPAPSAYLGRR